MFLTGMLQHERTRTLLDDLLMSALYAAFSLAEMNSVSQPIAEDLVSGLSERV